MGEVGELIGVQVAKESTGRYDFRYLSQGESNFFLRASRDRRQIDLTRQLLIHPEFRPTGVLHIGDRDFFVGKVIKTTDRDMAVMYVQDKRTGRLMPRVLYKSNSDGGWRSCPKGENGHYSKGGDIHYTQATKPHPDIIKYMEEAELCGHKVEYRGNVIDDYFDVAKDANSSEWNTFADEVRRYDDRGVLAQFQQYKPGYYTPRYVGSNPNLSEKFSSFDFSSPALKAFVPDFQTPPIKRERVRHTLLGYVTMESYSAQLNGRPIEWTMAYDQQGRVWIDRIAFTDTSVSSYGVSPEVIDSGALTNKPIEYRSQATALKMGSECQNFDYQYVDITPLLDNLTPIQAFRLARRIAPERIPVTRESAVVSKMPTIANARDFDELTEVLKRKGGLSGSQRFYSADELTDLMDRVMSGELSLNFLTRTDGFRDTVARLSFEQLYSSLDEIGGLQGSQEYYSAERLKMIIDQVRKGQLPVTALTRAGGLRDKVMKLLGISA